MREPIKQLYEELSRQRAEIHKKLNDIDESILCLRKICPHEFQPDGHDSHRSYEKCFLCGAERER